MAYEEQCGSCVYFKETKYYRYPYDRDNSSSVKGYCSSHGTFEYPDNSTCGRYESRDGTTCYITTIVCDRLGYDDHCDVLNTLRSFRNNVLQKDEKYKGILHEYDTVGPKIASHLKTEDISFVQKIYDFFLVPTVSLIKENKHDEAISKYVMMTKKLEDCYGIEYQAKVPLVYDYRKGGHGVQKKKTYKVAL